MYDGEEGQMKTMIALVSDQRMQNVIPVLQKGAQYRELILVLSKERSTGKPLERYKNSANDLKAVLDAYVEVTPSDTYVDPYDIGEIRQVIDSLIHGRGEQESIVVNISGGTKPMAIGAFQAAQSAGVKSVYTNTEDGELIWLFPDGSVRSEPIQVVGLDVSLYIRAYGETVDRSRTVADLDPKEIEWAKVIAENHEILYKKIINPLNSRIREGDGPPFRRKVAPTRRQRAAIQHLVEAGLWSWDDDEGEIVVADWPSANFLNGLWVEIYAAVQLQETGCFDYVRLNVTLEDVEGEMDVVAVSNGRIVLIECKSNVKRSVQLNKLDAFRRRLGGPYAHAYYTRASSAYARQIRSQVAKIRLNGVFFGPELRKLGDVIARNMGIA